MNIKYSIKSNLRKIALICVPWFHEMLAKVNIFINILNLFKIKHFFMVIVETVWARKIQQLCKRKIFHKSRCFQNMQVHDTFRESQSTTDKHLTLTCKQKSHQPLLLCLHHMLQKCLNNLMQFKKVSIAVTISSYMHEMKSNNFPLTHTNDVATGCQFKTLDQPLFHF